MSRYLLLLSVLGAGALVTAAVDESATSRDEGTASTIEAKRERPSYPIAVTRQNGALRQACRPGRAALVVVGFLKSINAGAADEAASQIAFDSKLFPRPSFSVSEALGSGRRRHFVAFDAASLSAYLRRRHDHAEELLLRELVVHDQAAGLGHFEFRINRNADDRKRRGRRLHGKGALDCRRGRLVLFAAGNDEEGLPARMRPPLCPRPDNRNRGAVVCAGRVKR